MLERSFGPIKGYATPMQGWRDGYKDKGAKGCQKEHKQNSDAVVS
jgi:hypothetical protein